MLTRVLNLRNLRPSSRSLKLFNQMHNAVIEIDDDVLDEFASQIVQKTTSKMDLLKCKYRATVPSNNVKVQLNEIHLKDLSVDQITLFFQDALDHQNSAYLEQLIDKCMECKKYPKNMLNILAHYSQTGDREAIDKLKLLCEICCPEFLRIHSDFEHFTAKAIWVNGDVSKSLEILDRVYRENVLVRNKIRLMLKYLLSTLICDKSEAALLNTISFSERLSKDFGDFFPLACVWQACFLSHWFTDQCTAFDLLKRNEGLCHNIIDRIPYVVFVSLKFHRTEVVYRLLEMLLAFDLKQQTPYILASLLDYQFCMRDLKGCAEIIQWSIANDVKLPNYSNIKSISLVLNEKLRTPVVDLKDKIKHQVTYKF